MALGKTWTLWSLLYSWGCGSLGPSLDISRLCWNLMFDIAWQYIFNNYVVATMMLITSNDLIPQSATFSLKSMTLSSGSFPVVLFLKLYIQQSKVSAFLWQVRSPAKSSLAMSSPLEIESQATTFVHLCSPDTTGQWPNQSQLVAVSTANYFGSGAGTTRTVSMHAVPAKAHRKTCDFDLLWCLEPTQRQKVALEQLRHLTG